MPSGKYNRSRDIPGTFKKGFEPHNKGRQSKKTLKKIDKFKNGFLIECKHHGLHPHWRLHTGNNVQCKFCCAEWQRNRKKKNPLKYILRDAKQHSVKRGRNFNLTFQDLHELLESQKHRCAYTGMLFSDENVPSLDRINSNLGYEKNNIQFIQIKINKMKSDLTEEEFLSLCKATTLNKKKKR